MSNDIFFIESQELLQSAERVLLDLHDRPDERPLIDELFRYIHTIKGSAAIFSIDCMVHFAHLFENTLDLCRQGLALTPDLLALALECNDLLSKILEQARPLAQGDAAVPVEALQPDTRDQIDRLSGRLARFLPAAAPRAPLPAAHEALPGLFLFDDDELAAASDEAPAAREEFPGIFLFSDDAEPAVIEHNAITPAATAPPQPAPPKPEAPRTEAPKAAANAQPAAQFARVKSAHLDDFVELIAELVTSSEKAALHGHKLLDHGLSEALEEQSLLLERLHSTTLQLRMAEVGESFQHLRRLVQRLNQELHKDVRLDISGQNTELDKTILERLNNPLTHILRNSMDHGVEPPQERLQAGKPAQGVIRLNAYHEFGAAVIEIEDDGRGIPRARILEKARKLGIAPADLRPDDQETLELIFHPGLSTSETVSNISGRGVGMDVVKRTVESLRGKISVHSTPGKGTRFTLRLPTTMALIRGLLVRVDNTHIIIPIEEIVSCREVHQRDLRGTPLTGYLEHHDQRVPFLHMGRFLRRDSPQPDRLKVVFLQQGAQPLALVVHELRGEHQTVIKSMGPLLEEHPCFHGAAILGDGTIAMVLNSSSLFEKISQQREVG